MALWGAHGLFSFVHHGGDALGAPRGVYQGAACRAATRVVALGSAVRAAWLIDLDPP